MNRGFDEDGVELRKVAEEAGRLFLNAATLLQLPEIAGDESWFQVEAWQHVVAKIDQLPDAQHTVADLVNLAKTEYPMAAGLPATHGPGGPLVNLAWEAVVRMIAAAILEGLLGGENSVETWLSWLRIKAAG